MRYESARTKNGNVGVSYNSQASADAQAAEMEANDCYHCSACYHCSGCYRCSGCYHCSDCSGCSGCSGCYHCSDCSGCYHCSDCSGCSGCSGCYHWKGPKAEKLIVINGLIWPVATDGKNIQIGCQQHAVEDWQAFDDKAISMMDRMALDFWKQFKATVLAMAEYRRSLG